MSNQSPNFVRSRLAARCHSTAARIAACSQLSVGASLAGQALDLAAQCCDLGVHDRDIAANICQLCAQCQVALREFLHSGDRSRRAPRRWRGRSSGRARLPAWRFPCDHVGGSRVRARLPRPRSHQRMTASRLSTSAAGCPVWVAFWCVPSTRADLCHCGFNWSSRTEQSGHRGLVLAIEHEACGRMHPSKARNRPHDWAEPREPVTRC